MLSILMQISHIIFQLVHLGIYTVNGHGFLVLDIFSTLYLILSQMSGSFLLIMIAFGWTINKSNDQIDALDAALPIGALIAVLHIMFGLLIYADHEEYHKYHDYGGI